MTNLTFLGLLFIVGLLPYSLGHIVLGETNGFYAEVVDHIAAWCMGLCLVFMFWLVFVMVVFQPMSDSLNLGEIVRLFFDSISMTFGFIGISIAVTVLDQVRSARKRKEKVKRRKRREVANRPNEPRTVKKVVKQLYSLDRLTRCIDI